MARQFFTGVKITAGDENTLYLDTGTTGHQTTIFYQVDGSYKYQQRVGTNWELYNYTRSNWDFHIQGSTGRFGLGHNDPRARLHLSGDNSERSAIRQSRTGVVIWDQAIDSSGRLQWGTRSTEGGSRTIRFALDDNGRVGIGVGSPETMLHIKASDSGGIKTTYAQAILEQTDAQLDLISTSSGTWGSAINFVEAAGSNANTDVWSIARKTTGGAGDSSLNFNFGTNNQHDNTNRVQFSSAGNISLGGVVLFNDNKGINFGNSNAKIYGSSANGIQFNAGGSEAMRLNQSGHINIYGNRAVIFDNTNNNNAWYVRNGGTNSATLQFGLGTSPGSNIKHIFGGNGDVTFAGSVHLDSDSAQLQLGGDNDMQIYHNGANGEINNTVGNFTVDTSGDIILDTNNGIIRLKDGGTEFGKISENSNNLRIYSSIQDGDILLQGNDAGTTIDALTLDMSDEGTATFLKALQVGSGSGNGYVSIGTGYATTSALTIHSVSTSAQASAIEIIQNGGNGNPIIRMGEKSTNGGRFHMFDGNVEKVAFYTDGTANHITPGNLGVGTSNPVQKLHVYNAGTARVEVQGTSGPAAFKATNSQGSFGWYVPSDANEFRLWNFGTSADLVEVDASGNTTFAGDIHVGANYVGRDGDNYIGFVTDNLIKFRVAGNTQVKLSDGVFAPQTDSDVDLGSNGTRFKDAYVDTITTTGNVTIGGNLEVTGTTTTVNQTNLDVSDNIIGLNRGASSNTNDSGLIIERGSTGDNAAFVWDESIGYFSFGTTQKTPAATGAVANESDWSWKPIKAGGAVFTGVATISQAAINLLTLKNTTNGGGAGIVFDDHASNTQKIYLRGYHSDGSSQGGGASLHLQSTEPDLVFVVGDSSNSGRIAVKSHNQNGEVDYGFYSDTNTGMYSPGAGQVGLVSDGSRKLNVNNNGVYIQNGDLYVQNNSIYLGSYIYHDGDTNTYFGFNGADQWKLHLGGGDRLIANTSTFTSNLKVKIPVAWDSGTLENNAIYAKNSTDGFGFGNGTNISTWWAWSSENGVRRMIDVANSGDQIDLRTGNSDRVRIDSDGLTVKNNGDVRLYTSGSQVRVGSFTSGSSNNGEYADDDIVVGDGSISIYPHRRGDYSLDATTATSTTFRSKLNIWSDNEDHITFGGASTHMVSAWESWKMWINNDSTSAGTLHLYNKNNI